jgi:hypothetical protein
MVAAEPHGTGGAGVVVAANATTNLKIAEPHGDGGNE